MCPAYLRGGTVLVREITYWLANIYADLCSNTKDGCSASIRHRNHISQLFGDDAASPSFRRGIWSVCECQSKTTAAVNLLLEEH